MATIEPIKQTGDIQKTIKQQNVIDRIDNVILKL